MTEEVYKNLVKLFESQQEELHRARTEELQRRDQQTTSSCTVTTAKFGMT